MKNNNISKNEYIPDDICIPGCILQEYLEAYDYNVSTLALAIGYKEEVIIGILKSQLPITNDFAIKISNLLGRPSHFWQNLERNYQDDLKRLHYNLKPVYN